MRRAELWRWLAPSAVCCVLAGASPLHADEESDRLFQDARTAMTEKRFDAACALFELSLAREPAEGTRVNLALCEVARGRFVRARELLTTADAHLAARSVAPEDERRTLIARELSEIDRRAPRLEIRTASPGARVELDGKPLPAASLGAAIVVDPGSHRVALVEPGGRVEQLAEAREGQITRVRLVGRPSPAPSPKPVPEEPSRGPHPSVWVVGSFAVASLAAGIVTGALGLSEKGDVDRYCNEPFPGQDLCTDRAGVDAAARGRNYAIASTATLIGAGLLTGVTIWLWVGVDRRDSRASTLQASAPW